MHMYTYVCTTHHDTISFIFNTILTNDRTYTSSPQAMCTNTIDSKHTSLPYTPKIRSLPTITTSFIPPPFSPYMIAFYSAPLLFSFFLSLFFQLSPLSLLLASPHFHHPHSFLSSDGNNKQAQKLIIGRKTMLLSAASRFIPLLSFISLQLAFTHTIIHNHIHTRNRQQ